MGIIVRDFDAEERADMRREAEFTARRIGLHHATCRRQSGGDGRLGKVGALPRLSARGRNPSAPTKEDGRDELEGT